MELGDYLSAISPSGNRWIGYHIMICEIRKYEKEYGIKIQILVKGPHFGTFFETRYYPGPVGSVNLF